jgi:hypothetical protein
MEGSWLWTLGVRTEFRSEKIPRNRHGMVSVIRRKKVLIPKHSEFRGRANSEARNRTELARKWSWQSTYMYLIASSPPKWLLAKHFMDCEVRKGRKRQRQMVYCKNRLSMASSAYFFTHSVTSLQIITEKIMVVDLSRIQLVVGM